MNKKEAAAFLGVSEKTIERYKSAGRIAAKSKRIIGTDRRSRHIIDFENYNESDVWQTLEDTIVSSNNGK